MNSETEWWRGAVIYQIYPRSFCDSNNDGVGDLQGISNQLDYIADLGVDAIWISPFFKSPMKDFGYDISDYYEVDPIFGCLRDFDELLRQAHNKGLRVIIDQVYSHTSDQCSWFKESRRNRDNDKADWYIWADAAADGSPPNNWESAFWGSAWSWDAGRKQYFFHNFLREQPDLNLHNPEVQDAVLEVARFWLDRGVDGFRLDATNYFMHDPHLRNNQFQSDAATRIRNESHPDTVAFIRKIRATMDAYPNRFSVAEIGGELQRENTIEYTAGTDHFHTAYNFKFLGERQLSAKVIRSELTEWTQNTANYPSWTFSNHDMPRVVSRWGKADDSPRLARMLLALLLTLRGTIFLYQGEELGLPQAHVPFDRLKDPEAIANWPTILGRDGARTPFPWSVRDTDGGWGPDPWLPIDDRHYALSAADQLNDENSTLTFCKQLLAIRKRHPALIDGELEIVDSPDDVLAFVRRLDNKTTLCVFNLSRQSSTWMPQLDGFEQLDTEALVIGDVKRDDPGSLPPLSGYLAQIENGKSEIAA